MQAVSRAMRAMLHPDNSDRLVVGPGGAHPVIVALAEDTVVSVSERVKAAGGVANVVVVVDRALHVVQCRYGDIESGTLDLDLDDVHEHHESTSMAMLVSLLDSRQGRARTRCITSEHMSVTGGDRLLVPA